MTIAELEAREDVRLPMTVHWNRAGKSATIELGDRSIHLAEREWSKWINLDFSINLLVRVHGMAQLYLIAAGPGAAALCLAGQLEARQTAGADVVAGVALGRFVRAARTVSHARLGRSDVAAQRGPHRREDVHGRSRPRVRRSRAGDPAAARHAAMGPARRRDRIDRSRPAHDVAAHRSGAPDVRQGARREVRRFHRARLPQVRRLRRRSGVARRSVNDRSWSSPTTGSTRSGTP